jgi:hypothetical protein
MAEVDFAKRLLLPRVVGRHSASADFQWDATDQKRGSGIKRSNTPAKEPQLPKRLDEIARLVRGLIYGDMIDFSDAIWNSQPVGSAVTQQNLPELLHRWSISHLIAVIRALENKPEVI